MLFTAYYIYIVYRYIQIKLWQNTNVAIYEHCPKHQALWKFKIFG